MQGRFRLLAVRILLPEREQHLLRRAAHRIVLPHARRHVRERQRVPHERRVQLRSQGQPLGMRQRLLAGDRRIASRDERDKILAAIRNRDSGAAVEAVREHLQYIASALLRPRAADLQAHGLIPFYRRK